MPLLSVTPIDKPHDAEAAAAPEPARPSIRRIVADFSYLLLTGAGFTVSTCLMVLGVPLFAFLALAGWDMNLFFLALDNISSRFIEADAARRIAFSDDLKIVFFVSLAAVALVRLPGFVRRIGEGLDRSAQP
jgi:hypothetical protein